MIANLTHSGYTSMIRIENNIANEVAISLAGNDGDNFTNNVILIGDNVIHSSFNVTYTHVDVVCVFSNYEEPIYINGLITKYDCFNRTSNLFITPTGIDNGEYSFKILCNNVAIYHSTIIVYDDTMTEVINGVVIGGTIFSNKQVNEDDNYSVTEDGTNIINE